MNLLDQQKDLILNGSILNATIRVGRFGDNAIIFDNPITVPISHVQKIGQRGSKKYGVMVVISNIEIDSIHSSISDTQYESGNTVIDIIALA